MQHITKYKQQYTGRHSRTHQPQATPLQCLDRQKESAAKEGHNAQPYTTKLLDHKVRTTHLPTKRAIDQIRPLRPNRKDNNQPHHNQNCGVSQDCVIRLMFTDDTCHLAGGTPCIAP